MAPVIKKIELNLLSNIVFLNLLLYHTGLKQSSLYRAPDPAIGNEITVNRHNKAVINKIKFIDSQLPFKNPFSFIPLKKAIISPILNKFHILIFLFGIYYVILYSKPIFVFLQSNNYKERRMHRCIVKGLLGIFLIFNSKGLEMSMIFTLCHAMYSQRTAFPLRCVNKNELNGPGNGIPTRGGLYSQLLYFHTRGWQPQPIHGHTDAALYWASSQQLVLIAGFFTKSIKRYMVVLEINQKIGIKENILVEPAARGLFFYRSLVICHLSLVGRFGDMMRNRSMDAWMHGCMREKMKGRRVEIEKLRR